MKLIGQQTQELKPNQVSQKTKKNLDKVCG